MAGWLVARWLGAEAWVPTTSYQPPATNQQPQPPTVLVASHSVAEPVVARGCTAAATDQPPSHRWLVAMWLATVAGWLSGGWWLATAHQSPATKSSATKWLATKTVGGWWLVAGGWWLVAGG